MLFNIPLDGNLYDSNSIDESLEEWNTHLLATNVEYKEGVIHLEIKTDDEKVCYEFLNYLLDKQSVKELN